MFKSKNKKTACHTPNCPGNYRGIYSGIDCPIIDKSIRAMTPVFLLLSFFFLYASLSFAQEKQRKHLYPVPDVISGVEANFYSTEGYVIAISECECPQGVECDTCGPAHIIVSDKMVEQYNPDNYMNYLTLFTNPAQIFETGKKYLFLIQEPNLNGRNIKPPYRYVTDYHEIPEQENGQ